jgi:hypothetical protein
MIEVGSSMSCTVSHVSVLIAGSIIAKIPHMSYVRAASQVVHKLAQVHCSVASGDGSLLKGRAYGRAPSLSPYVLTNDFGVRVPRRSIDST